MAEKTKVAHVAYDLQIGGVANILDQLLRNPMTGYEQILILLCGKKDKNKDILGVKTYRLAYEPTSKHSLPALFAEAINPRRYFETIAGDLFHICQQEKFDILHFHVLPKDLGIGSFFLRMQASVKLVYTDHALRISRKEYARVQGKLLKRLYRNLYRRYNTIFVSRQAYEWALEIGMIPKNRLNTYIENSIDLGKFRKKTDYSIGDKLSVVYVSRISAVKGHFVLPAVAELLIHKYQYRNFEFVLIGPGELTDKLKAEIAARNLDAYFRISGPMRNVPDLLPDFDIGVFPSEREGLPIALLEKMAAGLPVVATDIPEIKNVIQYPDEALLFPVNDPEACAAQLMRLVQDRSLRERTGAAARKAVEERYAEPLANRYAAFYNSLF